MIAVDTNVLVYAHRADSEWHDEARRCVKGLAEGRQRWALPWPCLHEFFGVVTHPRIYSPPTPTAAAIKQVDAWLEAPTVVLLSETGEHWAALREQLLAGKIAGPRVHDARVAALCLEHGVSELWSRDRDFGRFPGLATRDPFR